MKSLIYVFLLPLLLNPFYTFAQESYADVGAEAMMNAKIDVVYLASDFLEGRETGTKGETLAADYIAHRFQKLGLVPKGDSNTYFHGFDCRANVNPHEPGSGEDRKGKNVVAFLDNGAKRTVVIGAHYDHLGMGSSGSLHVGEKMIHNGADDNASGIAAMLYLAEQLVNSDIKKDNYLFIAFSGEELGLYGSKAYAAKPTIELSTVNYMLNMDMVGRLNEDKTLAIAGTGTSPVWDGILEKIKVADINISAKPDGIGPSDHTSFYLKDIPVLHFFTGQHSDYHKPSDDSELVNFAGILDVSHYIMEILKMTNGTEKLTFTKTKNEDNQKVSSFKVTLGVMPDYVYNGKGMRIDSVIEGRPAQKGGMQNGDVIIQIGDTEVKDIYGYMKALNKFEKGKKAKVTILRDGKELVKKVTF